MNGSVLGLRKREIDAKFDEILDFAEILDLIDMPVQSYSSGMQVRLGFAIATAIAPEILLVDEVLAVGDLKFRMKCIDRISQLIRAETAVILVSHSMTSIQRVCTRTIVMNRGRIHYDGSTAEGVAVYDSVALSNGSSWSSPESPGVHTPIDLLESEIRIGDREESGQALKLVSGQSVTIHVVIHVSERIVAGRVRIFGESSAGEILASVTSFPETAESGLSEGRNEIQLRIPSFPFLLGAYGIGVSVHGGEHSVAMESRRIGVLQVVGPELRPSARTDAGVVRLPVKWRIINHRLGDLRI